MQSDISKLFPTIASFSRADDLLVFRTWEKYPAWKHNFVSKGIKIMCII